MFLQQQLVLRFKKKKKPIWFKWLKKGPVKNRQAAPQGAVFFWFNA
jgi:hypothetical protein